MTLSSLNWCIGKIDTLGVALSNSMNVWTLSSRCRRLTANISFSWRFTRRFSENQRDSGMLVRNPDCEVPGDDAGSVSGG